MQYQFFLYVRLYIFRSFTFKKAAAAGYILSCIAVSVFLRPLEIYIEHALMGEVCMCRTKTRSLESLYACMGDSNCDMF